MSGIPSWAVKGTRVVCIRDDWHQPDLDLFNVIRMPMLREVLTVSSARTDGRFAYLQFAELQHHWSARNFRPLVTAEDDLEAHFRILLRQPVSDKEPAL